MHSEWAELTNDAISLIKETKKSGGRIIALGNNSFKSSRIGCIKWGTAGIFG
jgi:S-adenosylmethionine:tRNA-ribosyltransferase-isomerase (queuine synthetase)